MELFLGFVAGVVSVLITMAWLLSKWVKRVTAPPRTEKVSIPARIEEFDGMFYVYDARDGSFLVQGRDQDELIQRLMDQGIVQRIVQAGDKDVAADAV
jgi:hypothetical protein